MGRALGELIMAGSLPVRVARVAVRDTARARDSVASVLGGAVEVGPVDDLFTDEELDVVVELAGGIEQPLTWARATLQRGLPYVTGNKALLATHGAELAELAVGRGAALLASASVGGATPMIETVAHFAASGHITRLRGVLNATTTYILAAMGAGRSYDEALRAAHEAGYAEPDPSLDVEGRDAAQKIAILASVAWGAWRPEADVATRGIVGLAVTPGTTVRVVAEADDDDMRVTPTELSMDEPMARVAGVECLLEIELWDGEVVRISGPGAGCPVSVGAVYADLSRLLAGERPILFAPGATA
jgi:homoserine dehydrogenase